ncbi:acyl-coenzyme A thioesterase 13-like [Punica granatum]|uniref:Acyl-coenzyme A thioesterase 13 n=2 Tax=Punica granatum TaxID=22663 RepID=A0A218W9W9_PUNGR|nr:acyl-coenzyme A thioesterase 13-like [Punica granatum]OWM69446.1 hypothetical protein CDL15_Pgr013907 [Punica granatum]PKI72613.1 hypothetical protein CRG98_006990 [Punica granatum]
MEEEAAEKLRRYLEKGEADGLGGRVGELTKGLPDRFFESFVLQGLRLRLLEPGRVVCSLKVPPRLLNAGNSLHGGATATLVDVVGSAVFYSFGALASGVSVEINVSYFDAPSLDEEIEIEAKALHVGQSIGVISVELRKKNGKIIAQGRHTKYLAVPIPSKI